MYLGMSSPFLNVSSPIVSLSFLSKFVISRVPFLILLASMTTKSLPPFPRSSVVLPLNFTGEWQQAHFVNYLGADRPLILLDNYETDMGYFPLKWNDAKVPNNLLGTLSSTELTDLHWRNNPANETHLIPYVFVLGEFDKSKEDHRLISDAIDQSYELIQSEEGIKLFGHRSLY